MKNFDLEKVKQEVQKGTSHYILGIKFVTTETSEIVIQTIKKDMMIYKNINRFIIQDNVLEVRLDNNATLCAFYFFKSEVLAEVLEKLPELNVEILKL